jgi:hypothetical protein
MAMRAKTDNGPAKSKLRLGGIVPRAGKSIPSGRIATKEQYEQRIHAYEVQLRAQKERLEVLQKVTDPFKRLGEQLKKAKLEGNKDQVKRFEQDIIERYAENGEARYKVLHTEYESNHRTLVRLKDDISTWNGKHNHA